MTIRQLLFCLPIILCIAGWGPFSFFHRHVNEESPGTKAWLNDEIQTINQQADNLDQSILRLGLKAYLKAKHEGIANKNLLTIIDYSKPSTERRLWVIDVKKEKVLFNTWVTHGKNSGNNLATSFSNKPGSLKSSLGVFVTTRDPYVGSNGYSLRLIGLEPGINDKAYERALVFHGAWYADKSMVKKYGTLGRSWGCPAVSDRTARSLINTIKDKSLVMAYYPDRKWLNHSNFLSS